MKYPAMYHVHNRYFNSISYKKNSPLEDRKMRTVSPTIFDNKEITCRYNGKDRSGVVETVRHCVEKGYLLTVNTSEGYRSFWLNKTSNIAIVK